MYSVCLLYCILREYGRGVNDKEMYTIIIIIMIVLKQMELS